MEALRVVREFMDVFPEDLPRLPTPWEIEFSMEVLPGITPISIPPYRIALAEFWKLKKQQEELLDKGFIRGAHRFCL